MKFSKTLRLFYGEYPFKVVLDLPRNYVLDESMNIRLEDFKEKYPGVKIRREYNTASLFFKDAAMIENVKEEFPKNVSEIFEPDAEQLDYLLTNNRTEIRKKLTHGCRYRVRLTKPKKDTNFDGFLALVKKHPEQFVITGLLEDFMMGKYRYFYGTPYFYVKESKYLTLAQLTLPTPIKEVVTMITPEEVKGTDQCQATML